MSKIEKYTSTLKLVENRLTSISFKAIAPHTEGKITIVQQDMDCTAKLNKKKFTIDVFFKYKCITGENQDNKLFEMEIDYFGQFKCDNLESDDNIDKFCKGNAPAIIFPHLRSAVSMITLASGYPPLSLPVINFLNFPVKVEYG